MPKQTTDQRNTGKYRDTTLRSALLLVAEPTDDDRLSILHQHSSDSFPSRNDRCVELHFIRCLVDFLLNQERHVSILIDRWSNSQLRPDISVLDDLIARGRLRRETPAYLHERSLRANQ